MPGQMSLINTVPALVPSVFHSSWPSAGVEATKKVVVPMVRKFAGEELTTLLGFELMFLTNAV